MSKVSIAPEAEVSLWEEVDLIMREGELLWKTRNDYTMFTEGPQKDYFRCLLFTLLKRRHS